MQVNPLELESRSSSSTFSEEDEKPPAKSTPPRDKGKATLGRNRADTGSSDRSPGQAETLRRSIHRKTIEIEPTLEDSDSSSD
jgi:hypothetical protein